MQKNVKSKRTKLVPSILGKIVERRIFLIRGQKVMTDSDLSDLYEMPVKAFNQAVKRNVSRFPEDFMFQLSQAEWDDLLRSQFVTSKKGSGGRRYLPYVFTENGVAMLSSVLNSDVAIQTNIVIMRTFNRMREVLSSQILVLKRLDELEKSVASQGIQIKEIFRVLRELVIPQNNPTKRRKIGIGREA